MSKTYEQERDEAANEHKEVGGNQIFIEGADWANARAEKVIAEKSAAIEDIRQGFNGDCKNKNCYDSESEYVRQFDAGKNLMIGKIVSRDAMIEKLEKMLIDIKESCLCERFKTKGFDYGEDHKRMGKPEFGARWVAPRERIFLMLTELEEWKKTR